MKIAYLILAHQQLNLLNHIIRTLKHPDVYFFIHIDLKVKVTFDDISKKFESDSNIFFLTDRVEVKLGGLSTVLATLFLLRSAVKSLKFDYVNLISGQDLPIKTHDEIITFLTANSGKQFLSLQKINKNKLKDKENHRLCYYWLIDEMGMENSANFVFAQKRHMQSRKLPEFNIYEGSMWFTITYECAEYIVETLENDNAHILDYLKYCLNPEELIIQTIIMNSKFALMVKNDDLRYILKNQNSQSVRSLELSDLTDLQKSESLYARKFDELKNIQLLKEITNLHTNENL